MQISVRSPDRIVVQVGASLGGLVGCDVVDLTETEADALGAAIAQPNGGIVFNADRTFTALAAPAPEAPLPDPDDELAAAITASTTLTELKAALLGNTRAAAVKGRPL